MSGHSRWSSIKHKKGAADAKRGKLFTKLIKAITVAARQSGGDPNANPALRTAITSAKNANMPNDNIDRAIKKGTGELEGITYEEVFYEGYGPKGVAIYVQCLTDNKNRTTAEVRNLFSKNNGNMAGVGCVAWLFESKGLIVVTADEIKEDRLMEIAIDAGAEDFSKDKDVFEIITAPQDFENIRKTIADNAIPIQSSDLTYIPKNEIPLTVDEAKRVLKLVEILEDHEDIQNVYANFEIPDEVMNDIE
ncbi:MAG: YebC/PmpR family DNA-binding transcriptional regulator [Candidatus Omnitrophica bacterium]|nr:YebC/PmpR family DNA-binding transcriptional regulator [Candidatus Omnitrophota bacterium]